MRDTCTWLFLRLISHCSMKRDCANVQLIEFVYENVMVILSYPNKENA